MRIKTALLAVVMGVIVATAGTAHAVVVSKVTFKNTQLATFAFLETTIICADQTEGVVSTGVFISGGSFDNPFGSGEGTSIDIFGFFNSCTGESFNFANGFITGGITGPNQPLTSAQLSGSTLANVDFQSEVTVPVSLDLTFTGNGTLSASRGATQTRTVETPGGPFTITIQRGAFRNRTADVEGTITIDGIVFPIDIEFGATLLDNSSTVITVTK
jgi:hypothetical protein